MGLIAWYPLNGNLEDYGIEDANLIQSAAPAYVNGKIGKSLSAGGAQWNAETTNRILNHNKLSFCFWWKNLSNNTDKNQIFGNNKMTTAMGGRIFSLFRYPNKNDLHWSWQESSNLANTTSKTSGIVKGILPDNEWVHICITYNNPTAKLYVNGKYYQTLTNNYNINNCTFGYSTQVIHNSASRNMNDLRFYDHCLSNEEIKQIYQCLILHYPLGNGYGNENLLVGAKMDKDYSNKNWNRFGLNNISKSEYINGVKHIVTPSEGQKRNNGEGFIWTDINTSPLEVGETYTFSIDIMGTISAESEGGDLAYMYNSTESAGVYEKIFFKTRFRSSLSATHYNRYSMTFTVPSTAKYKFACQLMLGWGADIYYKNVKLEKGKNLNPIWTPNPADALYKTLGYDTTTEYDTSGFGNNGEKKNKPTYSADSPIGDSSIALQRTNSQYIQLPEMTLPDTLTINFWAKVNSFGGWQRFFEFADALQGANGNYRFLFGTFSNTKQLGLHIYGGSDGTIGLFVNSNIGEIDTNWHSYSISINKTILNIFYDGKNILNKTITDNFPIHKRQYSYIGKSSYAADAYFDGKISDFRIYSTALTADDIKQLYQTKAKIDKNGNVYGSQFIDNDYEEELLTTQKMTFHQANSQGTITYEINGNEVINIITMDNTISSWKYLFNTAFDKTKIINHKLKLNFKYKTDISNEYSLLVKMCKGNSTKPQTISNGKIIPKSDWQEYNGIITFGNTYDNQGIYISYEGDFRGGNLYIKDLSLKIYENDNKTDFTKKSQIITGELSELDSNKAYVYKNSKIITNQIIEN